MTTTTTSLLMLLVALVPGMSLGMALMGLFRSVRWSVVTGVILAALGCYFMPSFIVAIPVAYMFLGIWYSREHHDILYDMFTS